MKKNYEFICHPNCGLEKCLKIVALSNEATGEVEFIHVPEFAENYTTIEKVSDSMHKPLWLYKATPFGLIFHNDMDGEYTQEPFRPVLVPWSSIRSVTYQIAT